MLKTRYLTVAEISRYLRTDYEFTRRMLKDLRDQKLLKQIDNRYEFNQLLRLFYAGQGNLAAEDIMEEGVLTVSEVHEVLIRELGMFHISTTKRKVKEQSVYALHIKNTYRIPSKTLREQIAAGMITVRTKPSEG